MRKIRDQQRQDCGVAQNIVADAGKTLRQSQVRYKTDFDRRINPLRPIVNGEHVFVERQEPDDGSTAGARRKHKLLSKSVGPYEVIGVDASTVTIDRDGLIEKSVEIESRVRRRW